MKNYFIFRGLMKLYPDGEGGGDPTPAPAPQPKPNPDPKPNPAQLTPEEVIDIKKNYVKRDELEAANKRYDDLVKGILEGNVPDLSGDDGKPDIAKLKKELYHSERPLSNLESCELTLKLRKAIMDEGGQDPFLPNDGSATQQDIEQAERVAEGLQACVDAAGGDPIAFMAAFNQRVREGTPTTKRR